MSSLLEPDFLRRLERLRLAARRRFAGAAGGTRRSLRRGASVEFADHRAYSPGDDVRRIDWNVYARMEELVLRLYVAEEDLTLYLLVDTSESMAFGTPSKLDVAKRLAAALAYVGLCGSERVSVIPWSSKAGRASLPARGRGRVGPTFRTLEALTTGGTTELRAAVDSLIARNARPGLAMVISDFFDPDGHKESLDRLLGAKFEPALFHILADAEVHPEPGGERALVDSETGEQVEVTLDPFVLRAYQARLAAFLAEIEDYARRRGISYLRLVGDASFETALSEYLRAS